MKASTVSTPFFLACFISILDETLHKSAFDYTSSRPIYQKDQKHLNAKTRHGSQSPLCISSITYPDRYMFLKKKYLEHFPKCF